MKNTEQGCSKCRFLYLRKVTKVVLKGSGLFNIFSDNLEQEMNSTVPKFIVHTELLGF